MFLLATSKARQETHNDSDSSIEQFKNPLVFKVFLLRVGITVLQVLLFCTAVGLATIVMMNGTDDKANKKFLQFQYYYTVSLFSAFLLTYLAMFVVLVSRLKTSFVRFYERERSKVSLLY